ncbi:MAG: hypothetical protein HQ567_25340 [Candidatus Nealsonbacteria bacterium]|nr:hypothetical protein [Candidatus Nealsonbacteria bacterium]
MSTQAPSPTLELAAPSGAVARWWKTADRALAWAGERLNPILVKETRQALKSKQFMVTFGLLLACGWIWSIIGVSSIGPGAWHGESGPEMFMGYYCILAFPLIVIVPFAAFRSLAGEQEDRTYELMSITTLGPRQIVRGKLGSSVMQMLIYLSALSPCLAFTYMLRGLDFPTILFSTLYVSLGSLALSMVGLFLGTLTAEKHWQIMLSVAWIAGLLYAFGGSIALADELIFGWGIDVLDAEFWQVNAAIFTAYVAYFVLIFYAAASRITFSTDNRSTRLRAVMFVQFALATAWMAWFWVGPVRGEDFALPVYLMMVGIHWYAMGVFMTGESPELSLRVKRRLPQSFLGRGFLTWFNPGPGTGYVFATVNLAAAVFVVLFAVVVAESFHGGEFLPQWDSDHVEQTLAFGVLFLSYVVAYLGVGLLLVRMLRRAVRVGIALAPIMQILLLLIGCGVPWVVQMLTFPDEGGRWDYSLLQAPDPFWSLGYVVDDWQSGLSDDTGWLLVIVPLTALLVFLLNLRGVAHEVRQVRIAKPKRVAEEDAEKLPPPESARPSPWD